MYDPMTQSKIAGWRQAAIEGTLSLEDMKAAIAVLRQGRVSASYNADTAKRKKAIANIPSADSLLDELGDI